MNMLAMDMSTGIAGHDDAGNGCVNRYCCVQWLCQQILRGMKMLAMAMSTDIAVVVIEYDNCEDAGNGYVNRYCRWQWLCQQILRGMTMLSIVAHQSARTSSTYLALNGAKSTQQQCDCTAGVVSSEQK
jgi:hypothetical protein